MAAIGADTSAERRLRCNRASMRNLLEVAPGRALALAARDGSRLAGVLVATPPLAWPLPPPSLLAQLRTLFVQGLGVAERWRQVFEQLERQRPAEAHWYLAALGVEPELQGRGFGAAALSAFVATSDADDLPVWLETDRERNLRFYGRQGFQVEADLEVLGTRIWRLRREARTAVFRPPGLR